MEFVATIFGKVLDVLVGPVTRQLDYLYNYRSNVQRLGGRVQELQDQRERVRVQVREAERNGENIHDRVTDWLTKTDEKIAEFEDFQNDEGHLTTGCSNGSFSNLKSRHRLGRKAKKMIPQYDHLLLQHSNFATVSYRPEPEASDVAVYDNGYVPFKSRDAIVEEVMNAMRDLTIKMIGIYGQGGVGKTTLAKAVARKAKEEKLFNVVVMANITSTPDVRKIQGEMADMLGLRLDDESEIGRAGRLQQRLKKEKENTLIILDDLWAGLDLTMLGILFEDDDANKITIENMPNIGQDQFKDDKMESDSKRCMPIIGKDQFKDDKMASDSKMCKILLTSRHKEVLSSEMGVKNSIFTVNVMEEEESELLFNKVVGITDEDTELKSLSTKIVHKCENLPLAIVAAGKALKNNKNKVAWEIALQRLDKQEMTEVLEPVEFSTMLSYDRLQNEELRSIFLLCARLGKDPSIMYLVRYCIGLGIFQEANTTKEVRDITNESIQKLKNSNLLLDAKSPNCVTMHDMIRDAALSIAHKKKNVFIRRYVKLDEWPENDTFEKYIVISLHYCDIIDGIPEDINCPELKVLHIDSKDPSLKIPDKLFEGMKELRVLILTGIDLSSFPSSIKGLRKLRMLCLEQCVLGDNISIMGELKNLRVLSLLGSKFELFPGELRQLGKLQLFDISSCTKLKVIPSNVISELNSLQELYMGKTLIRWGVERKPNHSEIAILDELRDLQQLKSLDIYIQDIATLPRNLYFDKLDSYKIVIGDSQMLFSNDIHMPYQYKTSRVLALHLKKGSDIHSQAGIKMLFQSIEQLFLGEVDDLHNVNYELNVEGFPNLKHLTIRKNSDIQNIIYSTKWEHRVPAFPKLESMCLFKLESLEKICNCQLTDTSFRNLKTMKVKLCGQLKYLFSLSMARLLTELETLEVSECDSVGDIIVVERQENIGNDAEDDRISFPQMRYLTLQSLLELTCFYTDDKTISTFTDCIPLFNEKVSVPILESLELSSMNIKKVWGAQPLPSYSFENLTKLNVNNCGGLKYLFSLSMVGNLMKLQSLFVSACDMMKDIFDQEDIRANEAIQEVDVFPQLKKIKIINMDQLKTIWRAQASINSFSSLESVIIEVCHKLVTIFPPYMVGRFHNLGTLEVNYCQSVEEIFVFPSTSQKDGGNETNLRVVRLIGLPKLKHVWNKDPQGLLNFEILQHVLVSRCPSLENLFPFSIASDLMKLESLQIFDCDGMKEIVARDDTSNRGNSMFEFPKLTKLSLSFLPELRCFYQGTHAIEFQALAHLDFGRCGKLEAFDIETTYSEVKPILSSVVKVISNLEGLTIRGMKEMKWLQDAIGNNVYLMHNMKQLTFDGLSGTEILFWFLQRTPNLKRLNLWNSIKEAPDGSHVSPEKIGTVIQLKNMSLMFSDIPLNIGFENGTILQRIERLCIEKCYYSANLIPSSIVLTHLSYLEVTNCDKLRNLLTSSTTKSLVQLTIMKVVQCDMMEEIITVEEIEEGKEDEIVFGKLKSLELVSLRNLTSFCNCQSKLVFRFPSLEKVKVSDCLRLEKFSEKIMWTPNLEKVDIVEGEGEDKWYWEGDLNATIQNIFTDKVLLEFCQNLELSCHPELQQLWHGETFPPDNCFNNLRTLIVENCSYLSEVFPSRLLPYFKNLEELQVSSSPVEVIFGKDGNNLTETNAKPFDLKRMTLKGLHNLKCIWSKDPRSTNSFLNLKEMVVTGCVAIKTLFPESLARNLVRLKKLEIGRCDVLEEIVGKDEAVADGASRKFEFHYLTTLWMYDLPSLKFFYPGRYTLEFPSLENLHVSNCNKLDTFATDFQSHQGALGCEDEANITGSKQFLFIAEKVIPNLENLTLNGKGMMMLSHEHFPDNLLHKLKLLVLSFGDSYEAGASLPFKFFQKVPNLESLHIINFDALDEMFPSQSPEDVEHIMNILAQVRELYLFSLLSLSSIGLDNSWVDPLGKNLRDLEIWNCPRLTILVPPSAASFCNLKELRIWQCHGLVSLFPSSVAKSLVRLDTIEIGECGSITQIVYHGTDESASDEIIFERLQYLILSHLPRLVSFYSGNATLEFSALSAPTIEQCPRMTCFSQGVVRAPNFIGIIVSRDEYDCHNYSNLNTTIQKLFDRKQFTSGIQDLKLGDYPELEDLWHGVMAIPNGGFSKLRILTVDGCQFLSHFVIPFHLLGFLVNLEDLQVRNCDSIKAIFDVRPLPSPFSIPLKTLTLQQLSGLENVWSNDPREFLNFQSLQQVYVDECRSLKGLFPASMSQRKLESLEILHVESCDGLVEIVANGETVLRRATSNSIILPSLTTLNLWSLPQLKHIYSGLDNLEWPKLKAFDVYHCDHLRIFPTKGHGHDTTKMEDIVLFEKDFPNLEQVSLDKADIMNIIKRGRKCGANIIQRVKFLILQCFHEDSDGFPGELFQKELLPNLQKLRVICSNFKEIFGSQRHDVMNLDDNDVLFPNLKQLELIFLGHLESIGLEQSWVAPILENLETLKVQYCHRLRNLVASTAVSFTKLRELRVHDCQGLVYLFTLSTARSLVLLEVLSIEKCESIQEIVPKEVDGSDQHDITFRKLKTLNLVSLQRLCCFYSGNSTFNFPCLELVFVHDCPKTRIFSCGAISSTEHLQVSTGGIEYTTSLQPIDCFIMHQWSHKFTGLDLNESIELLFHSQLAQFISGMRGLKLGDYPELQDIWHGLMAVPNGGFSKLSTLTVDGCQFLSHFVIPFHLLGFFINLEELQVRNCDSVKAIFEVGSLSSTFSIRLKTLTLQQLPHLENVWNDNSQEFLDFQSLQQVYVEECRSLKSIFPASISQRKLESLEILQVESCDGLVEIVANGGTVLRGEASNSMFPGLTMLNLWSLPQLKCIYPGLDNLEWPKLKAFYVYHCDNLRIFPTRDHGHDTTEMGDTVLFEKDFPSLEQLSLDKADIMNIIKSGGKCEANIIQRVKFLILQCFHEDSDGFPGELFQKELLPDLEKLRVICCNFKGIFAPQRHDVMNRDDNDVLFPNLKQLELISLEHLESIGLEQSWAAPILENLETLKVARCHSLRNLVASTTMSFKKLLELHVHDCQGLEYLFTLSTARSLVLLEVLSIERCGSIQEIVPKEVDGSDQHDITFRKLKTLNLMSLQRLCCFYSGNSTFNFPCLELVFVHECPKTRFFSYGAINSTEHVQVSTGGIEYITSPQSVHGFIVHQLSHKFTGLDLNASIKSLFPSQLAQFISGMQGLKLEDYPELQDIWHGLMAVSDEGFSKLRILTVDGCQFLSHFVIPFHLLGFFINLEELQVRNCNSVKAIFEVGSLSSTFSIPLKTLTLQQLPRLENVWNDDPQEFLNFQSLQHVYVDGCGSLKSIFPASISHRKLESLEILQVESCDGLVEIIANGGTVLRGEASNSMFPSLTMLNLWSLPQLKCIYPGLDNLEWPKLKAFYVYHCDHLRIFPTKGHGHDTIDIKAIVSFEKDFPNLEQLSLDKTDIINIIKWGGNCEANIIQRVKFLILLCFHEDSGGFPCELFRKELLPNLEKLQVICCNFKEIFGSQIPDMMNLDDDVLFPHLKVLELISLRYLESIGFERPWVIPILENLETLRMRYCHRLRNLVPSSLSFSKLRELHVQSCEGLVYLFTLSTARSLVLLEELSISRCASIQEIVSKEDESDITFMKLKQMSLESLQSLCTFHSGNSAFNFPCLDRVIVHHCPRMRIFCCGTINASQNLRVSTKPPEHGEYRGMGLNASVELIFSTQLANFSRDASFLWLSDHPELQGIWEGVTPVPNKGFCNLKYLTVDGTQFLSYCVTPFHLLPFLRNLEDLRVRHCDSVKAIFEVGPMSTPFSFPLKKMILEELPNLEQVWNLKRMLTSERLYFLQTLETLEVNRCPRLINLAPSTASFSNLTRLEVSDCDGLVYLFTSSTAKSLALLEDLSVWRCKSIQEIVAIGVGESDEEDEITFGNLKTLYLFSLPSLDSFYKGTYHLKFPCLEQLEIYYCSQMKAFSHADIYAPDNVNIESYDDDDLIDMLEKAFHKEAT